jgi:hypothetical protein
LRYPQEEYIHESRVVWNDDSLPSNPPLAFPPALRDLHALAAEVMRAARNNAQTEDNFPSSLEAETAETERWIEACPVGSLIASNKSIVLQREWLIEEETSQKRRAKNKSGETSESETTSGSRGERREAKRGESSRAQAKGGLLNSLNNKEIKVALHMNAAADADVERQKRKEERRREQEQRSRNEEESFERSREELDNSRREWQLLREDREKQKRDAARQRERDKIDGALEAVQQLVDRSRLSSTDDHVLLVCPLPFPPHTDASG